ncbi:MAG TPA: FlgD immunoglobulin-like domain containing protein [Thermoanaerobaculia bacterium]|jgi:hypothetical protein|nr:FlgD immunoglobulin-like domain containing protein [Thermoanaerobaculia bacterium]
MRHLLKITFLLTSCLLVAPAIAGAVGRPIRSVNVDRQSVNVAAAESATVRIDFGAAGRATVVIVDRDGYPVRTLLNSQPASGSITLHWDGRDDSGRLVADEAYSLKIDWRGPGGTDTYFPANEPAAMSAVEVRSYDRRAATLAYNLSRASRVHIQAGTAAIDPKTKKLVGPVMKTLVNREPRVSGTISEHWNGYDESGGIFVPDLEDFVVAIAATPLPENSIITFGNRQRRFVDALSTRRGASLFTNRQHREHHMGLPTADDVSPALVIEPLNAAWSAAERAWITSGTALRLRLKVEGPTAAAFRRHPATVELFVDGQSIGTPSRKTSDVVEVPLHRGGNVSRVSINWNSDWGPVAANTIQVRVDGPGPAPGGGN